MNTPRHEVGKGPGRPIRARLAIGLTLLLSACAMQADVPPDIGPAHSGSWFNPSQSGHGFSVAFGTTGSGEPLAVVYWYVYDDHGQPLFLVGQGKPEKNRLELDLYSPVGMAFGAFDPGSVSREDGGTAVFEFSDRENGTFSYTPSAFTQANWGHQAVADLPINRLFAVPAPASFDQPTTDSCTPSNGASPYPARSSRRGGS